MIRIPLSKGYTALIDDEDAHLADLRWQVSPDQYDDIISRRRSGELLKLIAADYGVSISAIHLIVTGKRYASAGISLRGRGPNVISH